MRWWGLLAQGGRQVGLALALAGCAAASADETEPTDGPDPAAMEVMRVIGIRTGELPEVPTAQTTVIDVDDYRGEAKTLEDLLADAVGVQVRRFGGPGQFSEISIRGSTGQQVVVMLDGVRLNTAQSGTVDLSTIPLAFVERIEIVRGGGASWAGSGAMGGVVNIVTRAPDGETRSAAGIRGGSFGTFEGSLSHLSQAGGVDYGMAYNGFGTAGDYDFQTLEIRSDTGPAIPSEQVKRINDAAESHTGMVKAGVDLAPGVRLGMSDQLFFLSRGQPGPDSNPLAPAAGQSRDSHDRLARNVSDARLEVEAWESPLGPLRLETLGSYLHERTHFRDPEPQLGSPIDIVQKNRSAGWRGLAEADRSGYGIDHLGTLAVDARYDSLSSSPNENDLRNDQAFHRRMTSALSLRDELSFLEGDVTFLPGVRLDYTEHFGTEWIPQVGATVSPAPFLRFKSNFGRAYRAPNFDELYFPDKGFIRGNPNLDSERSWNADLGFDTSLEKLSVLEDLSLEFSLFWQDIENQIVWQRISQWTVAPTNTNAARVRGLELASGFSFLEWFRFSGNFTLQDAKLDRKQVADVPGGPPPLEQPGSAMPGRPESEYHLRLAVGPPTGLFKLIGERTRTSKIHVNASKGATISGRTTYDLSGTVDLVQLAEPIFRPASVWFPGELLASMSVVNVTDQSLRDSVGFPQPGRMLSFGLEARW